MNEDNLIKYYNKFNEDKRFKSRGGLVEYKVSLKYIYKYLSEFDNPKILDIGAGTGAYSVRLALDGYDVTAVELIRHNLRYIEKCRALSFVISPLTPNFFLVVNGILDPPRNHDKALFAVE